jgi:AbrB family looped-hinge helix DNA binding protein
MKMAIVKMSEKGQIAIPKEIRESMKLDKGDELVVLQKNGTIMLEKSEKVAEELEDDFEDVRRMGMESLRDVWDNKEDEIWDKLYKKKR